jgi:hypothetical protein
MRSSSARSLSKHGPFDSLFRALDQLVGKVTPKNVIQTLRRQSLDPLEGVVGNAYENLALTACHTRQQGPGYCIS